MKAPEPCRTRAGCSSSGRDGELTPVLDAEGDELVLDRPTSVEFLGTTGYVVSVTGDVYRVEGL